MIFYGTEERNRPCLYMSAGNQVAIIVDKIRYSTRFSLWLTEVVLKHTHVYECCTVVATIYFYILK